MKKLKNSELNRISVSEFKNASKSPIIIILDNIRSAHNVGSIFRTCDAFLISEIILCGITATPPNKEIRKKTTINRNCFSDPIRFKRPLNKDIANRLNLFFFIDNIHYGIANSHI